MREPSQPTIPLSFHDWETYGDITIDIADIKTFEDKSRLNGLPCTKITRNWGQPHIVYVTETAELLTNTLLMIDPVQARIIFAQNVRPVRRPAGAII